MGDVSWLNTVWFVLFVAIVAGYLIMDGFDLGVGILHLLVGKSDAERRVLLNSIGPVWDGNAVWLVVTGGALFAVFPIVYAALFSGFYGAMMLVLLTLILRPVAIEFRSKLEGPRWRALWDGVFAAASLGLALLLGVAFGNIVAGVPLSSEGQVEIGSLLDLLHPFALLIGATTVVMLAVHGALYLNLKTEGALQARVRAWLPRLMVVFALLALATGGRLLHHCPPGAGRVRAGVAAGLPPGRRGHVPGVLAPDPARAPRPGLHLLGGDDRPASCSRWPWGCSPPSSSPAPTRATA